MLETRFKDTEIGPIPEDWVLYSIGNHCSVKARIGWQGLKTEEYLDFGEYGLITSTDIVGGKIDWATCHFVSKKRFEQDKHIIVKEEDVLVSKDGTIGKVGIVHRMPFPATLNSGVFVIRTKCEQLSQTGLSLVFISPVFTDFVNRLTAGSTIVHLYQKDIVKFAFALPRTDAEQSRISSALISINNLISSLDKLIEKKKNIKQGAMQQLLTGKKRLKGFSNSLTEVSFRQICSLRKGIQINGDNLMESGPYAMLNGGITPSGFLNDYNVKGDTITISEGGNSCGFVSYMQKNFWAGGHCYVVEKKVQHKTLYIYYLLKLLEPHIMSLRVGSGLPNIQSKSLLDMKIIITDNQEEQIAIASILSSMDNEISALESKKAKYESIKQGMMQQLLTGKIRLI